MSKILVKLKDHAYYILVEKNASIKTEYQTYVESNPIEHQTKRLRHWLLLFKLNLKHRIAPRVNNLRNQSNVEISDFINKYYYKKNITRKSINEMCLMLENYEVISFDIFDTAIFRDVVSPDDVFVILGREIGHNDFVSIRKSGESEARTLKEKKSGSREVSLVEIYDVLHHYYGISEDIMEREKSLEIELSSVNTYIYEIYRHLVDIGKTIVFTSDMYLPKQVIERILIKNGYTVYSDIYISNELNLRKGDGSLQKYLLDRYEGQSIIHIGDSEEADVEKSLQVGLNAIHNPNSIPSFCESDMNNLAGSFYRSIINTQINNGCWDKNIYFEHGFRVGGILAAGFCEYINRLVFNEKIDRILFCARDCEIIWKVYKDFYEHCESHYLEISRLAIFSITSERYLYELVNRYFLRYFDQYRNSKTIEAILTECGFGYLVNRLEDFNINHFSFPVSVDRKKMERFIFAQKDLIVQNSISALAAAKKYFTSLIGDAKNILLVDIGWSGSCITAFKYFVDKNLPDLEVTIKGALMCTSRNQTIISSLEEGVISSYVCSPLSNMDLTRFMMPGKSSIKNTAQIDLLHMPLEYLFTSCNQTLLGYIELENGDTGFKKGYLECKNQSEIHEMQKGIYSFIAEYIQKTRPFEKFIRISPYVAFNPLKEAIAHTSYSKMVYQNFIYDTPVTPYTRETSNSYFGNLFDTTTQETFKKEFDKSMKTILFVTPELIYAGAPKSLLRMSKTAVALGYRAIVWTKNMGPFVKEYEKNGIPVYVVPENDLKKHNVIEQIKKFDLAICNTILTDRYAKICTKYIPTVWYIREATNIPDFTKNNWSRMNTFKRSKDLYCVSQYAADAIHKYTKNKVQVIHNCVEDESAFAIGYIPGTGDKVRFAQFGTIEYRKGYDVLIAAYLSMPAIYQNSSEVYIAGGYINSAASYCNYVFSQIKHVPGIINLGQIQGSKEVTEALSSMDVVVVASRDESCSLVALEGAMLSKPLIVTENVGAKYIVKDDNGIIVSSGDVNSLRAAMMEMIDKKSSLHQMGIASRKYYDKLASMEVYLHDMESLYQLSDKKNTLSNRVQRTINRLRFNRLSDLFHYLFAEKTSIIRGKRKRVVVSLTSHPGRIDVVALCIRTLLKQSYSPWKILLWLSKDQFPLLEQNLPPELLSLQAKNSRFEIRWVEDDLAPHKKYFYVMQEFPELPVITVDDDVYYDRTLVHKLMKSYQSFPDCVSCMRANLMQFKPDGSIMDYSGWIMDYRQMLNLPSYQLVPTGVGGVLYPPHSVPQEAFNIEAIKRNCLYTDDLWIKVFTSHNGYRAVVPNNANSYKNIPGTEKTALWRLNVYNGNNDVSMRKILQYYEEIFGDKEVWKAKMFKDICC